MLQREVFPTIEHLSQGFADFAAAALQNTLARHPQTTLIVPGGNTPCHYLPALARCRLPWERITVTLSDERWVDVNDEQSNEHLVKKYLMQCLPPDTSFIGLKTRHPTPFDAIDELHQRLDRLPKPLSLAVLGLGTDGHVASLFPGMNFTRPSTHHCIAVAPPIAPSLRISLALEFLARSERILLVVMDEAKRKLLDQLSEEPDSELPIARLLRQTKSPITTFETNM